MWTEANVALLKQLRAQGRSFSEIARQLHTSKGAIAGKVHRLSGYKRPSRARRGRGEPDPDAVLAAAIVFDGGTYEEAIAETGLDWDGVYRAVIAARSRDLRDRRRLRAQEAPDAA